MIFFFFQAEDGIRDLTVTGVQTCALPIYIEARETQIRKKSNLQIRSIWSWIALIQDNRGCVWRSEEHTSELQSQSNLVCRLLLEKKKKKNTTICNLHSLSKR